MKSFQNDFFYSVRESPFFSDLKICKNMHKKLKKISGVFKHDKLNE